MKIQALLEGRTVGPTETEGSLADAIRNKDLLAVEEMDRIAGDIKEYSILMSAAVKHQANNIRIGLSR
jgi:hypothetical protein